jgi:hypothetical protein
LKTVSAVVVSLGSAALLRYQAQLAEVTALRKQEADQAASATSIVQDTSEQWWWLAFALSLIAIAGGPKLVDILTRRFNEQKHQPDKPGLPVPQAMR